MNGMTTAYLVELHIDIIQLEVYTLFRRRKEKPVCVTKAFSIRRAEQTRKTLLMLSARPFKGKKTHLPSFNHCF